jgi:hypothetical protein
MVLATTTPPTHAISLATLGTWTSGDKGTVYRRRVRQESIAREFQLITARWLLPLQHCLWIVEAIAKQLARWSHEAIFASMGNRLASLRCQGIDATSS